MQNLPELFYKVKKLVILFLLFTHCLFANTNDSLRPPNRVFPLKYYTISQFEYGDSASYIENSLLDFQNYLPLNTLGNVGLPFNDFIYKTNRPFGFYYQKNYYQEYFYTPFKLNFYNTRIPYTDLFCVFGSKKEQYFNLTFSYNVKKNWNVTANFSRIKSTGFYQGQKTDHTFFALSSNYKTLDNRYMLLLQFLKTLDYVKIVQVNAVQPGSSATKVDINIENQLEKLQRALQQQTRQPYQDIEDPASWQKQQRNEWS